MEHSNIAMLERFDTIVNIMPYYANTYKAFLLLSSLWSTSRRKLDEFYCKVSKDYKVVNNKFTLTISMKSNKTNSSEDGRLSGQLLCLEQRNKTYFGLDITHFNYLWLQHLLSFIFSILKKVLDFAK